MRTILTVTLEVEVDHDDTIVEPGINSHIGEPQPPITATEFHAEMVSDMLLDHLVSAMRNYGHVPVRLGSRITLTNAVDDSTF